MYSAIIFAESSGIFISLTLIVNFLPNLSSNFFSKSFNFLPSFQITNAGFEVNKIISPSGLSLNFLITTLPIPLLL
jgi:hypothetical protein